MLTLAANESKYLYHCFALVCPSSQLIKAGADLNGRDVDGWTPLHAAAHWGQEEACRVLLESGCDMSLKNNCVSFLMKAPFKLIIGNFLVFPIRRE